MGKEASWLREEFQKYFEKLGHTRVASSPLVPHNDPTLLFTNAGMNQFKDLFLGLESRDYSRATSAQKVVRAGGKHNDLDNVGFTPRHHTFFEMLGNFSFGDYFKKDAIHFAWNFIVNDLGVDKNKLRVTVFDDDDETAEIWHKQEGVALERIVRFGEKDNFWSMGDTGPCGPCTEIFYDRGAHIKDDEERWLEFWNVVFMQYDRQADGQFKALAKPSVDTGMGFERTVSILQGKDSNYESDVFAGLIGDIQDLVERESSRRPVLDPRLYSGESSAIRVVADHLRSVSFLIGDGVLPSNEGRGYVLRRILRRGVRYGKTLGLEEPFLTKLYPSLIRSMGNAYPEIEQRQEQICATIKLEEERFFETLHKGLRHLDEAFESSRSKTLPAESIFLLYDSFGFPVDLTEIIASERGYKIDHAGFEKLMDQQKERARASWKGSGESALPSAIKSWSGDGVKTNFIGYETLECHSIIEAAEAAEGAKNFKWLAVNPCPFYGEGGGQVGDVGQILTKDGTVVKILNSIKIGSDTTAVLADDTKNILIKGDKVQCRVDGLQRARTESNHTATHLLHAALRNILGTHVTQAGSYVGPDRLRFDFTHPKGLDKEELSRIENWVNYAIIRAQAVDSSFKSYDEAISGGAMALFGEKYGDQVRVLNVPDVSVELCGGTHVSNTRDIFCFKIISESAVGAGVRRIEALSSHAVLRYLNKQNDLLLDAASLLKSPAGHLPERVEKLLSTQRELEKKIDSLQKKLLSGGASDGETYKIKYKDIPLEVHVLDAGLEKGLLRQKADQLRKSNPQAIHLIGAGSNILFSVDTATLPDCHAGDLLKSFTTLLGGRGGGQAQTAQGQIDAPALTRKDVKKWTK